METKTAHKADCKMAFGRKDATCPRFTELLAGAPARKGWNDAVRRAAASRLEAIRTHDFAACERSNVMCVCFDY
jgi:hypothetical protein